MWNDLERGCVSVGFPSILLQAEPSEVVVFFSLNPENDQVPETTTHVQLKQAQAHTRAAPTAVTLGGGDQFPEPVVVQKLGRGDNAAAEQESSL